MNLSCHYLVIVVEKSKTIPDLQWEKYTNTNTIVFLPFLPPPPPFPVEEGRACFSFLWMIIFEDPCSPIVWSFSLPNFSVPYLPLTWVSPSLAHGLILLPKYFFSSDFSPGQHPWRPSNSQGLSPWIHKLIMLQHPHLYNLFFLYVLRTRQQKPKSSWHCHVVTSTCCFRLRASLPTCPQHSWLHCQLQGFNCFHFFVALPPSKLPLPATSVLLKIFLSISKSLLYQNLNKPSAHCSDGSL